MGRPSGLDRTEAVEKALYVFLEHGHENAKRIQQSALHRTVYKEDKIIFSGIEPKKSENFIALYSNHDGRHRISGD